VKATGVVRKIDPLGRIVLPMELRRTRGIKVEDSMEIFVDGDMVILKKYQPGCVFCGEADETQQHKGKTVCSSCLRDMQAQLGATE